MLALVPRPCSVVLVRSPLLADRLVTTVPGARTVREIAEDLGFSRWTFDVAINGEPVPPADALEAVVPEDGVLLVRVNPGAFAGIGNLIAALGNALVSVVSTFGPTAALVYSARQALIPPEIGTPNGGAAERLDVTGRTNREARYELVPRVLGRKRVAPYLAAAVRTEVRGKKLYQRVLLTVGAGPVALADPRVGEDPVFKDGTALSYTAVMEANGPAWAPGELKLEFRQGRPTDADLTLFAGDVVEDAVAVQLKKARGWVTRRSATNVTRLSADVAFPDGLVWMRDGGGVRTARVNVQIRYRLATADDADPWTIVGTLGCVAKDRDSQFFSKEWDVTEGTYDVGLRRLTKDDQEPLIIDRTVWQTLRGERAGNPIRDDVVGRLGLVTFLLQLTNRRTSLVNDFTIQATTIAKAWTGSAWVEQETRQHAALYRLVLQDPVLNPIPVADARIDLTALEDWADDTDARGWTYARDLREKSNVFDVARDIATSGRAAFAVRDGKFSVVRDVPQTTVVQTFTPANAANFEAVRVFPDVPHALHVWWSDPASDDLLVDKVVYRDGYSKDGAGGTTAATEFGTLELRHVDNWDQAYALARYHLAAMVLRPERISFDTDIEHWPVERGDLVRVNAEMALLGLSAGRVKSKTTNGGGDVTAVTLDTVCTMEAAKSYGVVVRKTTDGTIIDEAVDLAVGDNLTLTFSTPIDAADPHPEAGDIFAFGERGQETGRYIVKEIEPSENQGARLTVVDEAPAVHTAATGTIPPYVPQITIPPAAQAGPPPAPLLGRVTTGRPNQRAPGNANRGQLRVQVFPARRRNVST